MITKKGDFDEENINIEDDVDHYCNKIDLNYFDDDDDNGDDDDDDDDGDDDDDDYSTR